MAVAVKQASEPGGAQSHSIFERLPYVCLLGLIYVLGSLGIVFKLLPSLLWPALVGMGLGVNAAGVILGLIMLVAATGLVYLGGKLLGPHAPPGARAGIFTCLVGMVLILLLTRWVSLWIEHWVYRDYLFSATGPAVGAILTAIIGLAMLAFGIRWLFKPATEKGLIAFESQGWFSATAYKPLQGQKVRRGTIVGLLAIAGSGIWILHSHGTLAKGSPNWELNLPFTGMVLVENPGNVGEHLRGLPEKEVEQEKVKVKYAYISRYELRALNDRYADPNKFVKLTDANRAESLRGKEGMLIPKDEFDAVIQKQKDEFEREFPDDEKRAQELPNFEANSLAKAVKPEPASGPETFTTLTLLPSLQFTLPLLLLAASIWLAWRIVNLPVFADFLIATEAELNKVSWTTKKRLYQDTLVVLSTVILMAAFLFGMDQAWRVVLSWRPIGVLQFPEDQAEQNQSVEEKPW